MTEYIRLMPISANVVGEVVTLVPIIGNPIAFPLVCYLDSYFLF